MTARLMLQQLADLRRAHQALVADLTILREQLATQRQELRVQFIRIAQMQAILDEEYQANQPVRRSKEIAIARTMLSA